MTVAVIGFPARPWHDSLRSLQLVSVYMLCRALREIKQDIIKAMSWNATCVCVCVQHACVCVCVCMSGCVHFTRALQQSTWQRHVSWPALLWCSCWFSWSVCVYFCEGDSEGCWRGRGKPEGTAWPEHPPRDSTVITEFMLTTRVLTRTRARLWKGNTH